MHLLNSTNQSRDWLLLLVTLVTHGEQVLSLKQIYKIIGINFKFVKQQDIIINIHLEQFAEFKYKNLFF